MEFFELKKLCEEKVCRLLKDCEMEVCVDFCVYEIECIVDYELNIKILDRVNVFLNYIYYE